MGNISRAVDYALEHYNSIGVTGTSMGGILSFYAALSDKRIKSAVCHCVLDLRNASSIFYLRRHFWCAAVQNYSTPVSSYSLVISPHGIISRTPACF